MEPDPKLIAVLLAAIDEHKAKNQALPLPHEYDHRVVRWHLERMRDDGLIVEMIPSPRMLGEPRWFPDLTEDGHKALVALRHPVRTQAKKISRAATKQVGRSVEGMAVLVVTIFVTAVLTASLPTILKMIGLR